MAKSPPSVALEALDDAVAITDHSRNVLVQLTGDGIDHRLVREAGAYVTGTGGKLVLVSVMAPAEFAKRQLAYASIEHLPPFNLSQAEEVCQQRAVQVGQRSLHALDIEFTAIGMVGREPDCLLVAAQQYQCGHLFLAERPQSPLRRIIARGFGQAITCRFDGLVTVLQLECDEESASKRGWTARG